MPFEFTSALAAESLNYSSIRDFLTSSSWKDAIPYDSIEKSIDQLSTSVHLGLLIIALIIALLGCFFGYKFVRFFMSLTGFILGLVIGYTVFSSFVSLSGIPLILATIASGLVLAAMSYTIYRAAIFLLCFIFAFAAAATFMPFDGDIQFFLCVLVGFIVGAISQKFIRPVIILTSAISCGSRAGLTLVNLLILLDFKVPTGFEVKILACAIISILGIITQFATTKAPEPKAKKEKS